MARRGCRHGAHKFGPNTDIALHPGQRIEARKRAPEDLAVLRGRRNDGRRFSPPPPASLGGSVDFADFHVFGFGTRFVRHTEQSTNQCTAVEGCSSTSVLVPHVFHNSKQHVVWREVPVVQQLSKLIADSIAGQIFLCAYVCSLRFSLSALGWGATEC